MIWTKNVINLGVKFPATSKHFVRILPLCELHLKNSFSYISSISLVLDRVFFFFAFYRQTLNNLLNLIKVETLYYGDQMEFFPKFGAKVVSLCIYKFVKLDDSSTTKVEIA